MNYILTTQTESELYHHGVKGMKWGVRRAKKQVSTSKGNTQPKKRGLTDNQKKAIKIGAAAIGTALAAYGGYKLSKYIRNENAKVAMDRGRKAYDNVMKKYDLKRNKLTDLSIHFGSKSQVAKLYADNPLDNVEKRSMLKSYQENRSRMKRAQNLTDKLISNQLPKYLDKASNAERAAYNRTTNVNIVEAAKNVYNYKKRKR